MVLFTCHNTIPRKLLTALLSTRARTGGGAGGALPPPPTFVPNKIKIKESRHKIAKEISFIHLNCGRRNEKVNDHRSYIHNLSSCVFTYSFFNSFFLLLFKCMNFHIFTVISSPQRVYEFTQ